MMHLNFGDMSVHGCCRKAVIALALILVSAQSFAVTYTWTGGANDGGKWSTPANWGVTSGYPGSSGSSDTANIKIDAVIDLDVSKKIGTLSVTGNDVRISGSGNKLTVGTNLKFGPVVDTGKKPTASSTVVLDSLTIQYSQATTAAMVYQGTELVLQNDSTLNCSSTAPFIVRTPQAGLTLSDSTVSVSTFRTYNGASGTSTIKFMGTHPLLQVRSQDSSGSFYMNSGFMFDVYFMIPKGGYKDVEGNPLVPVQLTGTKALFEGSSGSEKSKFYIHDESEALCEAGKKTYTLISSAAGTKESYATLNNIVPTEDSKASATLAWEDETVEDVTTVGKYLKATIDVPRPKGLVIMFY